MGASSLRHRVLWVAIASASVAGCWTLSADLDLSGGDLGSGPGPNPGPNAEGGTDGSSPRDGDAPRLDGQAQDAPGDGAPARFCESVTGSPRICDDFDDGPLAAKWTEKETASGGTIDLGSSIFTSAPNALFARAPNGCAAGTSAQLIDVAPGAPAEVAFDFDLSIAETSTSSINLVGIYYERSGGYYRVDLAYVDGHLAVVQNNTGTLTKPGEAGDAFPANAWKRVSVVFTVSGSPRALVKVDGATQIDTAIGAPAPSNAETKLDFGMYVGSACTAPVEVRFDNVLYRLTTK